MAFLTPHNARDPETAPALARIPAPLGTPPAYGADPGRSFCSGPQWAAFLPGNFRALAAHLSEKRGQLRLRFRKCAMTRAMAF